MNGKTTTAMLAAVIAVAGAGSFASAQKAGKHDHGSHAHGKAAEGKKSAKTTVRGEVIDVSCYMAHEGKGPKHKKCAKACILDKGLPMGILTKDGTVVFLIEDHAKEKAYKQVKELAAEQVEITGMRFERGGTVALSVQTLKKI